MELTKEQIEQAIKDWTYTLELAKVIDIDSLYEKSKRINTQHGLCNYFYYTTNLIDSRLDLIFEEFIHSGNDYICNTIHQEYTYRTNNNIEYLIEKRIEVLKTLLSRC